MDDDKRFSYFFLGLGLGVALGVLFAPKSGEETREFLKDRAGEGKDFLKRKSEELRDQAGELLDRGKQAVARQKDQITAAVEAGKQAYRETVSNPAPVAASDDFVEGV